MLEISCVVARYAAFVSWPGRVSTELSTASIILERDQVLCPSIAKDIFLIKGLAAPRSWPKPHAAPRDKYYRRALTRSTGQPCATTLLTSLAMTDIDTLN